ncbi:MAG: tRNA pseudouridine(38-40) synthase TruA [Coriobacteriia bacterium]|nr:tRNA pseudouridine(38-40) synthase TruA [Coriobacteriia bacterium]
MDRPFIALTLAYDGAPFAGFARQRDQTTVQGRIEEVLQTVLRRDVETVGAGRTDTGVHALGQVVSFESAGDEPEPAELLRSLNALAGPEIVAKQLRFARPGFSARFDAIEREYRYRIVDGPTPPLFLREVAWWNKRKLDVEAMSEASRALIGEHDFRSFCVAESAEGKSTVRAVKSVQVERAVEAGEECLVLKIVGNAFLHSMVRVLAGTLAEVGSGRRSREWVAEVLAARDRAAAGQTAPAHGLTMWRVSYPEDVWL